jgi:hypothetical protein
LLVAGSSDFFLHAPRCAGRLLVLAAVVMEEGVWGSKADDINETIKFGPDDLETEPRLGPRLRILNEQERSVIRTV